MNKSNHGGKREGAGRPPSPTPAMQTYAFRLTPEQIAWLKTLPNKNKFIRQTIDQARLAQTRINREKQ